MKAKITIEMDNSAFLDNPALELSRILSGFAGRLEKSERNPASYYCLYDTNGNNVGDVFIEGNDE